MDSKFLEQICEAYVIDRKLHNNVTIEELFKEVYKGIYSALFYDIETYNQFHRLSKLKQKNIVYEYLDRTYLKDEIISEFITFMGYSALSLIVGWIIYRLFDIPQTRLAGRIMKDISKWLGYFENFGSWIAKKGRYWKFKYAVLNQQREEDFRKCGIHPNDITGEFYSFLKTNPNKKNVSVDAAKKAKCLREAFVNNLIDHIALVLESYFVCLKKTGNFEKIENMSPLNIIETISKLKLSPSCIEYHNYAQKQLSAFNDILDTIYDNNGDRQNKINQLVQKISRVKNKVSNTKNFKQYK